MINNLSGGTNEVSANITPGPNGEAVTAEQVTRQLNSLLRGEISAAETYRMAIDSLSGGRAEANAGLLEEIQRDHGRAAQALRSQIRELGAEASDSSGAWGAWATAVQGTMNLFGDASALKALKEGEEHGLKDYQDSLKYLDAASVQLIQNQFIPTQQKHITLLDQLISQAMHA